jgi:1-acyl-sn-glycerol-3-phosphate acyltransferase
VEVLCFIPFYLFKWTGMHRAFQLYARRLVQAWGRHVLWFAGGRVDVRGVEHVPATDRVCFLANHQGAADIPLVVGYATKRVGFIAKKELTRVPMLNLWMEALNCVYIERTNPRSARRTIEQGAAHIRRGNPMLIFPEGTRSRGKRMRSFKTGSLRLPMLAEAVIVPLTIDGTYRLLEEKGRIRRGEVTLTIHPPIDVSTLRGVNKHELRERIEGIISAALPPERRIAAAAR